MNPVPDVANIGQEREQPIDIAEARRQPRAAPPHQLALVSLLAGPKRDTQVEFRFALNVDPMQCLIAIMEGCVNQMNQLRTAERIAAEQEERRIVVPSLRIPTGP